ncbi:MAG TPA: stage V sporulation protein SpoVM [Clostridiaceae bacterium]|nr:stage V sporulation protein SpoVM [Clostridiaceae bacterium]
MKIIVIKLPKFLGKIIKKFIKVS